MLGMIVALTEGTRPGLVIAILAMLSIFTAWGMPFVATYGRGDDLMNAYLAGYAAAEKAWRSDHVDEVIQKLNEQMYRPTQPQQN